jgi:hypothetical protein
MKEIRTSGTKEFIYSMIWAVVLLLIGRGIINTLPYYKIFGTIFTIIMFCVLGFFVLTRYCSCFTYENTGYSLRVNRAIGKRNKEIEFNFSDIISISNSKPANTPKPIFNMRTEVFSHKRSRYIIFGYKGNEHTLVFEPSDNFMKELKKSIKQFKKENKNG